MTENLSATNGQDQTQPARRGGGLAWLAILAALVSLSASGWLWWQDAGTKQDAGNQFAADLNRQEQLLAKAEARSGALESQVSALAATDPDRRLKKLEQDLVSLQQSTGAWQSFQDETGSRIRSVHVEMENAQARLAATEARLSVMSARTVNGSVELDQAEVDYLLRLAQERLALFADTQSADRALEMASRHIDTFDDPMYIGIQREIAAARQKLSLLHPLDYQLLDRKLDALQGSLGSLAFKGEGSAPAQQEQVEDSSMWARLRNAFSGLITVRRNTGDDGQPPVLADQELIRQRAWLELEVARWAAARRDQDAYAAALNRFSATLERWFEPAPDGVATNLRDLLQQNVDPALPDISAPWTSLRALQGSGISRRLPPEQAESLPELPARAEAVEEQHDEDLDSGDRSQ